MKGLKSLHVDVAFAQTVLQSSRAQAGCYLPFLSPFGLYSLLVAGSILPVLAKKKEGKSLKT
jgi:hypothetical protein